jgi:hypothetical protein
MLKHTSLYPRQDCHMSYVNSFILITSKLNFFWKKNLSNFCPQIHLLLSIRMKEGALKGNEKSDTKIQL